MGRLIILPKWIRSLWFSVLIMLCLFHRDKAAITCRSCHAGDKWRARELLLKFDTYEPATASKQDVFGRRYGIEGSWTASAESDRLRCADKSAESVSGHTNGRELRLKRNTRNLGARDEIGNIEVTKIKVSQQKAIADAGFNSRYTKRARRNSADKVRQPPSADIRSPEQDISSAVGSRVSRSELRWSGRERRAVGPLQEELKLNSSTFALTGDSAHNQAMVHWSGQNSSVSDLICL